MAQRLLLHSTLKSILGSNNVYFQPPASMQLSYPAIIYNRDNDEIVHAQNKVYDRRIRYQVTVIDKNPDSDIPNNVAKLAMCKFNRFYTSDNLNHDVFNIFF